MNPEELKKLHEEQTKIVNDLRATLESKKAESAESKEKVEKMEVRLGSIEESNQKLVAEIKQKEAVWEELKSEYKEIQAAALRASGASVKEKNEHVKAFEKFIVHGKDQLTPDEMKYLRTNNGASGGYLAPNDMAMDLLKNVVEISPMRQIARVRKTTRASLDIPRRSAEPTGYWVGQGGTVTESESTYALENIPLHKLSVYSIISTEMLNDSAFDMEAEIMADAAEDLAQTEGAAFIAGTGVGRPEGITVNTTLTGGARNSEIADDIKADNLIDLAGDLKTGYNPVYICRRSTLAAIRKMKDGAGQYVWQSGLSAGLPNSINGYPYKEMPDMPAIAASAYPVAFGDFRKGYNILDGVALYVIRDEFSLSTTGKIKFVFIKFVGGKPVVTEAIKLLKCAVS